MAPQRKDFREISASFYQPACWLHLPNQEYKNGHQSENGLQFYCEELHPAGKQRCVRGLLSFLLDVRVQNFGRNQLLQLFHCKNNIFRLHEWRLKHTRLFFFPCPCYLVGSFLGLMWPKFDYSEFPKIAGRARHNHWNNRFAVKTHYRTACVSYTFKKRQLFENNLLFVTNFFLLYWTKHVNQLFQDVLFGGVWNQGICIRSLLRPLWALGEILTNCFRHLCETCVPLSLPLLFRHFLHC